MAIRIQKYFSPGDYLDSEFKVRKNRNGSYSLRAFARDLGMSHTHLILVIQGRKILSLKMANQICLKLGLGQKERSEFLGLVTDSASQYFPPVSKRRVKKL